MANYYGNTRTNYFRVIDEKKYNEIAESIICSEDSLELWTNEIDGVTHYGFGVNDDISGVCECEHCLEVQKGNVEYDEDMCEYEYSYDKMCELLQSVVHPEDAIIIVSTGYEKLRYVGGYSTIITTKEIIHKDLWTEAINTVKTVLDNKDYNTTYSY